MKSLKRELWSGAGRAVFIELLEKRSPVHDGYFGDDRIPLAYSILDSVEELIKDTIKDFISDSIKKIPNEQ